MDFMNPFIEDFFKLIRGHLMEIMLVFAGTVLSVYGNDINKAVMKQIKKQNFFVRFGTFVALCVIGYGLITLIIGKILVRYMRQLDNIWLILVIAGLFILIGLIAEEKNHI